MNLVEVAGWLKDQSAELAPMRFCGLIRVSDTCDVSLSSCPVLVGVLNTVTNDCAKKNIFTFTLVLLLIWQNLTSENQTSV